MRPPQPRTGLAASETAPGSRADGQLPVMPPFAGSGPPPVSVSDVYVPRVGDALVSPVAELAPSAQSSTEDQSAGGPGSGEVSASRHSLARQAWRRLPGGRPGQRRPAGQRMLTGQPGRGSSESLEIQHHSRKCSTSGGMQQEACWPGELGGGRQGQGGRMEWQPGGGHRSPVSLW